MSNGSGERVELGRLDGAWGVTGWVKVFSYTDPPQNIFTYQPWQLDESPGLIRVLEWKQQGPRLIARLDVVESREAAELMHGKSLSMVADELPQVENGSYYWRDLIGLQVINRQGELLGQVDKILDASVHDVLCVRSANHPATDVLIPFVLQHYVDQVDLEQRRILVDWQRDWSDAD